ncbi:MAG: purine-nucleoside phosphorylase [Bacteroidales bacterium]
MLAEISKTANWIRTKYPLDPEIGIILGSGLSHLSDKIDVKLSIPYSNIPGFPVSTVEGHEGSLVFGTFAGKEIIAMKGRFHFYEGYSMKEITLPVRVMKMLGVRLLVISNAAGGVNPAFNVGDIMLISDHINLMGTNPLLGKNHDSLGPRFPDMSKVYDPELLISASEVASELNIHLQTGVYAAVSGPTYETPAEYRYIRTIGADAVGMSTVPEAIVARHMGLKILAMSVITDLGTEGHIQEISHDEVIRAATAAEPSLTAIIQGVLAKML